MSSSRKSQKCVFPSEKKGENNRKTELFDELLADFKSKKLGFPRATAETEGNYVIGVLCNALWYITNDHESIANRCKHVSGLIPVQKVYETYAGYNDIKRKRLKANPLQRESLAAHSNALYGHLMKPYIRSSVTWREESKHRCLLNVCTIIRSI